MSSSALDAVLRSFWQDVDAGRVLPLADYLTRLPSARAEIEAEYASWNARKDTLHVRQDDHGACPSHVGRYVVQGPLARGGMGLILRAHDPELGRDVVLKTLAPTEAWRGRSGEERLRREARIGGKLLHPLLCSVLDMVTEGGAIYLVLPFVPGETLAHWIGVARARRRNEQGEERGPVPPALEQWIQGASFVPVVAFVEQMARALHAAHEQGVVHRDVKPSNVLVRPDGSPFVLDLGIATEREADAQRLTDEGQQVGTPAYMAPEQVEGRLEAIDARTDVHALGVLLYECLTLSLPFSGRTLRALYRSILDGDHPRPRSLESTVPRDLEAVCEKAMSREPEQRYATAREFAEDLARVRELQATRAKPLTTTALLWRKIRRNPRLTLTLASLCLCVVTLSIVAWRHAELLKRTELARILVQAAQERSEGRSPAPATLERLRAIFRDDIGYGTFVASVLDTDPRAALERLLRELDELVRSPPPRTLALEAPEPTGKVVEGHLRFRGGLRRDSAGSSRKGVVVVESESGLVRRVPFTLADGTMRLDVVAPEPASASDGSQWRWHVELDGGIRSEEVPFSLGTATELSAILLGVGSIGDPGFDELARAAALLDAGFALASRDALVAARARITDAQRIPHRLLLGRAAARTKDREHVAILLDEQKASHAR